MLEKSKNHSLINHSLKQAQTILKNFLENNENIYKIDQASTVLANTFKAGNKAYSCGNGGSMCDAIHFAEELSGKFRHERPPLPAISISDPAHITCVSNDYSFEQIFARYLSANLKKNDFLLAISTSGNSKNIINASKIAQEKKAFTLALCGKKNSELEKHANICINVVNENDKVFSDRIQEIHIKIIHIIIESVEKNLAMSEI